MTVKVSDLMASFLSWTVCVNIFIFSFYSEKTNKTRFRKKILKFWKFKKVELLHDRTIFGWMSCQFKVEVSTTFLAGPLNTLRLVQRLDCFDMKPFFLLTLHDKQIDRFSCLNWLTVKNIMIRLSNLQAWKCIEIHFLFELNCKIYQSNH